MTLDPDERAATATEFGVAHAQVERDYLISLILGHLSSTHAESLIFFGGTALARTHLPNGRLSEDIDLIAITPRSRLAAELTRTLPRSVQRQFGRLEWETSLSAVIDTEPARLITPDGRIGIKIQLLSRTGTTRWPTEPRRLTQRYRNTSPATLSVPTRPAFAAAKAVAWYDRAAPRDLWDLWALARINAIDHEAATLFQ
ncbi:nucleotidyl transferase AbiEii/AbiGii toxin family protein [Nocardia takedensis]|uniref:nucleotidyl transferase AbiEii/AbiGii toxin family protein n=1 Tax=Nocardia takedensis TaxID=259390 RepID=UPI0002F96B5A|nr:nucleotidyl transferase AbiEii/AbiGii toxin family protein [Nocardia takedensis]